MTCAIRELREETGIVSSNLKEIGRVIHHGQKSVSYPTNSELHRGIVVVR